MGKIKASVLIFDFDGTISDSLDSIVETLNIIFRRHGLSTKSREEVMRQVGLPIEDIFKNLHPEHDVENVDALVKEFREIYYEDLQMKNEMFPGVKETLEELKKRGKILCIASSKKAKPLNVMLEKYEIKELFDFVVGADEVKERKPAPEMIEKAIENVGCSKEEVVMIGDARFDIEMAKNAGVRSIGVSYGVESREKLLELGADVVIDNFSQILEFLEQ